MSKKEIYKFLKKQLKNLRVIKSENDNELNKLNIIKDGRIDSLKLINLLLRIENKYNIKISSTDLSSKKKQTINKISEIIFKKIKKK
jgi:hypothetical protein